MHNNRIKHRSVLWMSFNSIWVWIKRQSVFRWHEHETGFALGREQEERGYAYRELFKHEIPDEDIHLIRKTIQRNFPLESYRFKEQIEQQLNRRLGYIERGRTKVG